MGTSQRAIFTEDWIAQSHQKKILLIQDQSRKELENK